MTEAGKRLLYDFVRRYGDGEPIIGAGSVMAPYIAAIEAEAVAAERARIASAVTDARLAASSHDEAYDLGWDDGLLEVLRIVEADHG